MVDFERSTPPTRIQHITKRKLLQLGMASALASGMLAAAPVAHARITQIQILTSSHCLRGPFICRCRPV